MPTKIQIRRGTGQTPPADLSVGEFAYSTDVKKLFIGTGEADPYYITINSVEQLSDFLTESGGVPLSTSVDELQLLDGLTANSTELNRLDGITSTTAELNLLHNSGITNQQLQYLQGLSANIQAQLNVKASSTHTHTLGELTNVSDAAPSANSVLKWNNTTQQWEPSSDEEATLATLGITVTASDLNNVNDKLSKTATGQVITQNITMGPIGQPGDDASSRQIIFNSTTAVGGGANVLKSLGTNNAGQLIFDGTRVLTAGTVGEDFLTFTEAQTLTTGEKETALGNLGVTATPTELNYTDGVTSAIQTQLNTLSTDKAPKNSPQFTGTPTLDVNPNTNDVSTRIATTAFVNNRLQSLVLGSGVYTETTLDTLEDSDTFLFDDLLGSYDKILFTLYLVTANSNWFTTSDFEGATIQVFPSLELNRLENTFESSLEGTCSNPAYTDQASCEFNGGTWTGDPVTVFRNGKVFIGNDGAVVERISGTSIQFTEPTPISGFTWRLRITGVSF